MHTPGPYTVVKGGSSRGGNGASEWLTVRPAMRKDDFVQEESDRIKRLIETAPKLLAALKAMLEPWHERLEIHDRTGFLLPPEVHQARAAIAKATGNEP